MINSVISCFLFHQPQLKINSNLNNNSCFVNQLQITICAFQHLWPNLLLPDTDTSIVLKLWQAEAKLLNCFTTG